jgi:hypothetical protein
MVNEGDDAAHNATALARPPKRARHLCSLGTGEAIHVLAYKAIPSSVDEFGKRELREGGMT